MPPLSDPIASLNFSQITKLKDCGRSVKSPKFVIATLTAKRVDLANVVRIRFGTAHRSQHERSRYLS